MTALSCLTTTSQLCSPMPPVQVIWLQLLLGRRKAGPPMGTSVAERGTPLFQDPVITLFSKQRLPEVFGNYGFPLL